MSEAEKAGLTHNEGKHGKCRGAGGKPKISAAYLNESVAKDFTEAFNKKEPFVNETTGAVLHASPFQCCQMPNFIEGAGFLENLATELTGHKFFPKNNDLYKFHQTDDLKVLSTPCARYIRELFANEVCSWMRQVTGIPLNDQMDLSCSRYTYTDTLLCHDDELDSRRIAFILYLVPPWLEVDGGALDLYDMDEYGQPNKVVKSLLPKWNTLAWFEVTEASHHQVAEVLSKNKDRLSINGWFHGPVVPRKARHKEIPPPVHLACPLQAETALSWINPMYWDEEIQLEIQQRFEEDSEIELTDFLVEDKYEALVAALQGPELKWKVRGPPNKRCYFHLSDTENLPPVVQSCVALLTSEPVFLLLSQLTGLALHSLSDEARQCISKARDQSQELSRGESSEDSEPTDPPDSKKSKLSTSSTSHQEGMSSTTENAETACCHACIRKWKHGCYTLAHDSNTEMGEFALDAVLYINCGEWKIEHGGQTSYIAVDEDEELLTISPEENSLALVYRDEETLKFVKHINHQATHADKPEFCDIAVTYFEKNVQEKT